MQDVNTVEVIASKGIVNDRYFNENNDQALQITLIESENIDYYNQISETNIPYISFRRNIITKGIQLNDLVGKEILIGNVKIKGHRLCAPCRYLQEMLKQKNLVKKLLNRGGLRCEILTDGIISVNDPIKQI
ncbi:uncharacterized protein METZ01_LOCUS266372 [marine metagenome]|uniref:MOSC domain-containing protein n=1 Tax=marine metagenome TaxID=408172 RepID=A0A382JNZ4_9ZZZZ